jgi:hypothetical protein
MQSRVQKVLNNMSPKHPCFREYGSLVLDVRQVKAMSVNHSEGIKILFIDGKEAVYKGSDLDEVRRLVREDFGIPASEGVVTKPEVKP